MLLAYSQGKTLNASGEYFLEFSYLPCCLGFTLFSKEQERVRYIRSFSKAYYRAALKFLPTKTQGIRTFV